MAPKRASVLSFLAGEFSIRNLLLYAVVFLVCFGTAKFGQYLFYTADTSPALIWPPFGIALAAILVGGYRMWLPIALAELLAVYTLGPLPLPLLLAAVIGQTAQPLIGAWAMRRFDFDNNLSRVFDAFILIGAALFVAMIAPSFSSLAELTTHSLTASFGVVWIRSWAGGMLSILILTPLVTSWLPPRKFDLSRVQRIDAFLSLIGLSALVILLSWTTATESYGLTSIYLLLALLVWISIRMEPRTMTLALFLLSALGMAGSFIIQSSTAPLNATLFSQELFIEFLAVIFLVICALAEERRLSRIALEGSVIDLSRALKKIEHEDIAKNQFIATLAHELRNPLAPVVSALDLLTIQTDSKEALQTIEGAQRELNVMRRLLDDILDVARVSQNRFRLQREFVDIRPLLERCVESTRAFLRNRQHSLVTSLPNERVIVDVDPVRFQQIVVNLINNAGKYTKPGGRITLSCSTTASRAVVEVRDNGIGIPQESLNEIFEPFRQIRPTPQIGTGLGIGLWLTKRLVEMHGGTIDAQSLGSEQGSSFIISFPLQKDLMAGENSRAVNVPPVIPPFKILIVDDNEAAAQAMQKLLRLKGHEARTAYDGRSAVAEAAVYLPRVILLDIGLPDMSGYEVAKLLQELKIPAMLVALTGYGQEEDKELAKSAGFDYHLTKPVGIADIERVLAQVANR